MDAAKAAVEDFMGKSGHHDTTVHEKVAPAVTHETIERREHEDVQTALDKEVHQDHYHTSVQPVTDEQRLREEHHHNLLPVEHRSFEHDNQDAVQQKLAMEQSQFKDSRDRMEGAHTSSAAPVVAGEHIHHHVHETIQPVVQKQTIEPHVVHTTVPIHEVHHNASQHHSASALPAVSMGDFKKQGGVLAGREERYDGFQGEPRSVGGSDRTTAVHSGSQMGGEGLNGGSTDAYGSNVSGSGKPSMGDKLNPKTDADRDGKAGIMDWKPAPVTAVSAPPVAVTHDIHEDIMHVRMTPTTAALARSGTIQLAGKPGESPLGPEHMRQRVVLPHHLPHRQQSPPNAGAQHGPSSAVD